MATSPLLMSASRAVVATLLPRYHSRFSSVAAAVINPNFGQALLPSRCKTRACPSLYKQTNHFQISAAMANEVKEAASSNPGLGEKPDEATKGYFMQQTMFRIKDPKVSLDFYSRVLGMKLLKRLDFPEMKFSLYFMGYEDTDAAPTDPVERTVWTFSQKATIELTHNWGTESDPNFKGYHNGNSEPRGFGHIGITVDDTYKACERFEKLGVEFAKKPDDGGG